MPESALVLGGGVGGMTAAHELADRGFSVTVLEHRGMPGGKARSMPARGTGVGGRPDLPAEHGFRFFPGFYKHVPDTMKRIPYRSNKDGVFDNLEPATRAEIAQSGKRPMVLPSEFPSSLDDLHLLLGDLFHHDISLPEKDKAHFVGLLVKLLGSCEERRYLEYEDESWWQFSEADKRSDAYKKFLADGLTRTLVAARARTMSARTGGYILLQLLLDMAAPGVEVDRVLGGPTNEMWIGPWHKHLVDTLHVDYRTGSHVTGLQLDGHRISSVEVRTPSGVEQVTADWIVSALPVEVMTTLVTDPMRAAEPRLDDLGKLTTRWMNGVMLYLARDLPLVHGHVIYIDSPWALTSISQAQFWPRVDLSTFGAGDVGGILSIDVSEWQTAGLHHPEAMACSKEQVIDEVIDQVIVHLDVDGAPGLTRDDIVGTFVDTDIEFTNPHKDVNLEPLLVNTAGSWAWRPNAKTAIENLFLASDYVRTFTDLATMEGANEAARRAVNGIIDASGSKEPRCGVWPLHEPAMFAPIRALDRFHFRRQHGAFGAVGPGRDT